MTNENFGYFLPLPLSLHFTQPLSPISKTDQLLNSPLPVMCGRTSFMDSLPSWMMSFSHLWLLFSCHNFGFWCDDDVSAMWTNIVSRDASVLSPSTLYTHVASCKNSAWLGGGAVGPTAGAAATACDHTTLKLHKGTLWKARQINSLSVHPHLQNSNIHYDDIFHWSALICEMQLRFTLKQRNSQFCTSPRRRERGGRVGGDDLI